MLHVLLGAAIAAVPVLFSSLPLLAGLGTAAVAGLLREVEQFFRSDAETWWRRLNLIDRVLDVAFFGVGGVVFALVVGAAGG